MSEKLLLKGALLLTAAGLFNKILSAGYRIPLQNMAGDEGFYIYQQVYPFIIIASILSLYGYPAAISKLVTEPKTTMDKSVSLYISILLLLIVINWGIFSILYLGADYLAKWMGDPYLASPIQYTSYLYLLIPFTSFLRGSFQSSLDMRPTALSQSVEQIVRVSFILLLTYLFLKGGKSLYDIGSGAAFASTIAIVISIIVLLFIVFKNRNVIKIKKNELSIRKMGKAILASTMVVSLNYMVLVLIQMVDNFTMIPALQEFGFTLNEAKIEKGIFDRGLPLVQLGIVFGSSLSLALIPTIHQFKKGLESGGGERSLHLVIKLTFLFSIAATVGLILIMPSVNVALFETSSGTLALRVFSVMILIMSITLTLSTFLQGYGFVKRQVILFSITLVIKWILNLWFIPLYGIVGSALSSVVSGLFLFFSFVIILKRQSSIHFHHIVPLKRLLIALISMSVGVLVIKVGYDYWFSLESRLDHLIFVIVSAISGAIIFFSMMIKLKGISKDEIEQFPFGEKLIRFLNH